MSKKGYGLFRGMRYSDFLFLWVLFANLILVVYLGVDNHQRALKVAYTQTNGEQIIAWFEGFNQKLQEGEHVGQQSCVPVQDGANTKSNTWRACIDSLFATSGPFHDYTNLLMPEAPLIQANVTNMNWVLVEHSFLKK